MIYRFLTPRTVGFLFGRGLTRPLVLAMFLVALCDADFVTVCPGTAWKRFRTSLTILANRWRICCNIRPPYGKVPACASYANCTVYRGVSQAKDALYGPRRVVMTWMAGVGSAYRISKDTQMPC
jgi:hypothetical protein